jgi:putative two-component system response regulator
MKTVFVIDDIASNLVTAQKALSADYKVLTMQSAEKMFKLLEKVQAELILLDIQMPDMDGFEAMRVLKTNPNWKAIPVIFLTAEQDPESEERGLELGAIDYIYKPFSPNVLRRRVAMHIETDKLIKESQKSLRNMQSAMISVIAEMVESRDTITGTHIERTQRYVEILVNKIIEKHLYPEDVSTWDLTLLIPSVQMHDLGKISVRDAILNKPGKLTDEEFKQIQSHTTEGVRIIDDIMAKTHDDGFLRYAKLFAGYHHEKWDGSGYPYHLRGEAIPLQGRIMAIADVYDALVTARPYKEPMTHEEAVEVIKRDSGVHFDPTLVEIFEEAADDFWVQSMVM